MFTRDTVHVTTQTLEMIMFDHKMVALLEVQWCFAKAGRERAIMFIIFTHMGMATS